MAHWVAMLKQPQRINFTGKTKDEVIFKIASALTNRSRYLASTIEGQLRATRESVAIAYGTEDDEVAKVFSCNCGSVKRHTEVRE